MLKIIPNRKYNYILSGVMMLVAILSLIGWGLKPGLDFIGGSLMELKFNISRPASDAIVGSLKDLNLGEIQVQPAGEDGVILRFREADENTHQQILSSLGNVFKDGDKATFAEMKFESIGPVIGKELLQKSWLAIFLASAMIILYIAYAFRRVSRPVVSWKYGVAAVVALIHDIFVVTGAFSLLGHFFGLEVDGLFVTALLTILGFSVHDTIVVFDRIRENLARHYSGDFEETANTSVNQTLTRSINTSLTVLITLFALYFFGGRTVSGFILALIIGITIGTYSSIFVASPLIVDWYKWGRRLKAR